MNRMMKQRMLDDFREVLASEAGKRIFGSIFRLARLNYVGKRSDYAQGWQGFGGTIANAVRQADPMGVAECEIAYANFEEEFREDARTRRSEFYGGTDE